MKFEVAVLGSLSLKILIVSVDVKPLNLNSCLEFGLRWSLLSGDRERRGEIFYAHTSPQPDSMTDGYDWWSWWDMSGYDTSYYYCPEVDEDLCNCQDYCYITYDWDGSVYRVNLKS